MFKPFGSIAEFSGDELEVFNHTKWCDLDTHRHKWTLREISMHAYAPVSWIKNPAALTYSRWQTLRQADECTV